MGVIFGDSAVTRFSYIEYQALMMCLAGTICTGLLAIELTLNRMQVLPLLFPGMFCIRDHQLYFFDLPVEDVDMGHKLHRRAKMLIRMTLCVVLSYLWQHCVLETEQIVGTTFPHEQCNEQRDCFASELHYLTLVNRQHTPVDCSAPTQDFPTKVVISCIRFVKPSTTTWLMHLAISHSVTQLNLKSYEILTWIGGSSSRFRRLILVLMVVTFLLWIALFFSGVMSEFVSSWLSFVMSMSIPTFLWTVYTSAKIFDRLQEEVACKTHARLEQHLQAALASFESTLPTPADLEDSASKRRLEKTGDMGSWGSSIAMRAKTASSMLTRVLPKKPSVLSRGLSPDPSGSLTEIAAEDSTDELDKAQMKSPPSLP